jgi:hypothetical protein
VAVAVTLAKGAAHCENPIEEGEEEDECDKTEENQS